MLKDLCTMMLNVVKWSSILFRSFIHSGIQGILIHGSCAVVNVSSAKQVDQFPHFLSPQVKTSTWLPVLETIHAFVFAVVVVVAVAISRYAKH